MYYATGYIFKKHHIHTHTHTHTFECVYTCMHMHMHTSTSKHVFETAQKYLPCSSKTEWHLKWKTTWLCWSNGSADSTAISSRYRARANKCSETFLLCTALYKMTNTMAWNTLDRRSFRGSSYAGLHGPGIRNGGQGGPWPLYLPACVTLKNKII